MTKTIALRRALQRKMEGVCANLSYNIRPEELTYPAIVYDLRELTFIDGKTVLSMSIDVLDYGTDTSRAETLSDRLQKVFDRLHYIDAFVQFSVYVGQRGTIAEEDKKVIRRHLTFEIQLHGRSDS